MWKELKYYSGVAGHFIRLHVQAQMEYPLYLLGWLVSNPMQCLVGILTIYYTVANFGSLGGWGFGELLFLYGLAYSSHGLSVILFIQTWYMKGLVLEGEFDRFLVRPLNVFFQFSVMEFCLDGITDLIPGVVILVWGWMLTGFELTVFNILKIIAVLLGATFIRGAVYLACGSIPLYFQGANALVDMNIKLFTYTGQYPLTIYPRVLQAIFTFILPLGFISFYPAAEFLGKPTGFFVPNHLWIGSVLCGALLFAIAYWIFAAGMKRYESAGS